MRIESALNLEWEHPHVMRITQSTYGGRLITMRITQSTYGGRLNPDRPICLEARQKKFEMAGSSWSIQESRALLNLWGDGHVRAELGIAVRNKAIF